MTTCRRHILRQRQLQLHHLRSGQVIQAIHLRLELLRSCNDVNRLRRIQFPLHGHLIHTMDEQQAGNQFQLI